MKLYDESVHVNNQLSVDELLNNISVKEYFKTQIYVFEKMNCFFKTKMANNKSNICMLFAK